MIEQNYKGFLLAAHPKRPEPILRKGVMLIVDHDRSGAIGLQINKPFTNDLSFKNVMNNVGLSIDQDQPLYHGGIDSPNRVHVIHSLDWYSPNTVKITEDIGISHDISILSAISAGEGPDLFRVCAGITKWLPGHLEAEVLGEEPWEISQSWTYAPAEVDIVFGTDDLDQWHKVISESSRLQVSSWF